MEKKIPKKKSTKSLWIYAAVLFAVAIGLILVTTLTQAKLVSHQGNIEVLGTLTQSFEQNVASLTEQNDQLTNELNQFKSENATLKAELEERSKSETTLKEDKLVVAQAYEAYAKKDKDKLRILLETMPKERMEEYMPGFYDLAAKMIAD